MNRVPDAGQDCRCACKAAQSQKETSAGVCCTSGSHMTAPWPILCDPTAAWWRRGAFVFRARLSMEVHWTFYRPWWVSCVSVCRWEGLVPNSRSLCPVGETPDRSLCDRHTWLRGVEKVRRLWRIFWCVYLCFFAGKLANIKLLTPRTSSRALVSVWSAWMRSIRTSIGCGTWSSVWSAWMRGIQTSIVCGTFSSMSAWDSLASKLYLVLFTMLRAITKLLEGLLLRTSAR